MYEIKPIFDKSKVELDLPNCMYKMKTVYGQESKQSSSPSQQLTNGFNGAATNVKDLVTLQKRQADIVKQLEQLRFRLNEMQTQLGVNADAVQSKSLTKPTKNSTQKIVKPINTQYLQEVVIHVNPSNIPFSLIGLQTQWSKRLNLLVDCYTHSSIVQLAPLNQEFVKHFNQYKLNSSLPTLKITLIWKQTPNTLLLGVPGAFIPITGEVNVIRYLMRIGPSEFGYDDSVEAINENLEIDAVLDLIHELLSTASKNGRTALLKRLSHRLGTQKAFGGSANNVSDVAVHSALKQLNLNAKELPANIKTWWEKNKTTLAF